MSTPVAVIARLSLTADQLDAVDFMAASHGVTRDDFLTGLVIARVPAIRRQQDNVTPLVPPAKETAPDLKDQAQKRKDALEWIR